MGYLHLSHGLLELGAGLYSLFVGPQRITGEGTSDTSRLWSCAAICLGLQGLLVRNVGDSDSGKLIMSFGFFVYHSLIALSFLPWEKLGLQQLQCRRRLDDGGIVGVIVHAGFAYFFYDYLNYYRFWPYLNFA